MRHLVKTDHVINVSVLIIICLAQASGRPQDGDIINATASASAATSASGAVASSSAAATNILDAVVKITPLYFDHSYDAYLANQSRHNDITDYATVDLRYKQANNSTDVVPLEENGRHGPFGHTYSPFEQQPLPRFLFIVLYSVVCAVSIIGNLLVIFVILRCRRMRTVINCFLANLALADLLIGIFCVPPNLFSYLSPYWYLGKVMCKLYFFIQNVCYTASIILMTVISLERYAAIVHPVLNRRFTRMWLRNVTSLIIWLVAIICGVPLAIVYDTVSFEEVIDDKLTVTLFCVRVVYIDMTFYVTINFILRYCVPLIIMTIVYSKISCELWQTTKGGKRRGSSSQSSFNTSQRSNNYSQKERHFKTADVTTKQQDDEMHQIGELQCNGNQVHKTCKRRVSNKQKRQQNASSRHIKSFLAKKSNKKQKCCTQQQISTADELEIDDHCNAIMTKNDRTCKDNWKTHNVVRTKSAPSNECECLSLCASMRMRSQSQMISNFGINTAGRLCSCSNLPQTKQNANTATSVKASTTSAVSICFNNKSAELPQPTVQYTANREPIGWDRINRQQKLQTVPPVEMNKNQSSFGFKQRTTKYRSKSGSSSIDIIRTRRKAIKLLIAVVASFALCYLPYELYAMKRVWTHRPEELPDVENISSIDLMLPPITFLVLYFKSILNPLLYALLSENFRKCLRDLCGKCSFFAGIRCRREHLLR